MLDGDASDIVEYGGQFVALRCFQYCQLVVWLTYRVIIHLVLSLLW